MLIKNREFAQDRDNNASRQGTIVEMACGQPHCSLQHSFTRSVLVSHALSSYLIFPIVTGT